MWLNIPKFENNNFSVHSVVFLTPTWFTLLVYAVDVAKMPTKSDLNSFQDDLDWNGVN